MGPQIKLKLRQIFGENFIKTSEIHKEDLMLSRFFSGAMTRIRCLASIFTRDTISFILSNGRWTSIREDLLRISQPRARPFACAPLLSPVGSSLNFTKVVDFQTSAVVLKSAFLAQ